MPEVSSDPVSIARAFKGLETPRQQRKALVCLYETFSKQNVRDAKALAPTIEFRYDIVDNLPAEIVQLVSEHVGYASTIQCRCVSRKWLHLFSSESLIKSLIEPWRLSGEFDLKIPEGITSRQTLDLMAEHELAFREGNPFAHSSIRMEHDRSFPDLFSYSEGYLAWVEGDESLPPLKIAIHHIESGARSYRVMPERERIYSVTISSKLLAAISYGAKCYIWTHLSDTDPCSVRLPSILVTSTRIIHDNVVIMTQDMENAMDSVVLIQCALHGRQPTIAATREFGLQRASTKASPNAISDSELYRGYPKASPCVMLDKTGSHLIVVRRSDAPNDSGVYLQHYDRQGKLEFEGHIEALGYGRLMDSSLEVSESVNSGSERFFNIWSIAVTERKDRNEAAFTGRFRFRIEYLHVMYYPFQRRIRTRVQMMLNPTLKQFADGPSLLRKGVLYSHIRDGLKSNKKTTDELVVLDVERGTKGYVNRYLDAKQEQEEETERLQMLGDETFVLQRQGRILDIWCFDKHVRMAREDSRFRRGRKAFSRVAHYDLFEPAPRDPKGASSSASSDFELPDVPVRQPRSPSLFDSSDESTTYGDDYY